MSESETGRQGLITIIIMLIVGAFRSSGIRKAVSVVAVILCAVLNSAYKNNCENMGSELAAVRLECSKLNPQGAIQRVKNCLAMHGFLYNTFGRFFDSQYIPKNAMLAFMAQAQMQELANRIVDGQLDNINELIENIQKNISISKNYMPSSLKFLQQNIEARLDRFKYLLKLKKCIDSKLAIVSAAKDLTSVITEVVKQTKNTSNAKYACADLYTYYALLTQIFENTIVPYEKVGELKASIQFTYKNADVKHVKRIDDLIKRIDNITEASIQSKKQIFNESYKKAKSASKAKNFQDAISSLIICYTLAPDNPSAALALVRLQLRFNQKKVAKLVCADILQSGNEKIAKVFTPLLKKCE